MQRSIDGLSYRRPAGAIEMVNIKILESLKLGGPNRNVFESDHEQNPFVQNNANDSVGSSLSHTNSSGDPTFYAGRFRAEYGKTSRAGLLLHTRETLQWLAPDVLAAPWWSVC